MRNRTSTSCRNGMFSQRLIAPRLTMAACSRSKNGFGKMWLKTSILSIGESLSGGERGQRAGIVGRRLPSPHDVQIGTHQDQVVAVDLARCGVVDAQHVKW